MEPSPERAGVPAGGRGGQECASVWLHLPLPPPNPTHLHPYPHPYPSDRQHGTSSREREKKNVSYKPARQADAAGKKCHEEPNSCGKEKNWRATGSRPGLLFWRGRRRRRGPRVSCVYIPKVSCLDERNVVQTVVCIQEAGNTSADPVSHEARVQNVH